jgi:predicted nucleotidyltransferase
MNTREILSRIQAILASTYHERLRGVVLYGSAARGQSGPDSDIDVLVRLSGEVGCWSDTRRIIDALYDLQLEIDRPLHVTPVRDSAYQAGVCALYRNAMKEGITA